VLTMDLHAPQIQGFFDVPVDHLYAAPVLNDYVLKKNVPHDEIMVVSPDAGSIKRALGHAQRLRADLAIVDKRRTSALDTRQENLIGSSVEGKVCFMFDDMITTAGSICGAAQRVHAAGAKEIHVLCTHGVLCGPALERLRSAPISSVVITDTIPLAPEKQIPKVKVMSVASLLGEAIKRIHHDQSISQLFEEPEE
jgi:ribose-phosphate pyrophosphokinase